MVIMAEISSLSPPPPLGFKNEEGAREDEGCHHCLSDCDFNKRKVKGKSARKLKI